MNAITLWKCHSPLGKEQEHKSRGWSDFLPKCEGILLRFFIKIHFFFPDQGLTTQENEEKMRNHFKN